MERILETEVMDDREEALEYDAMDFTEVNTNFAKEAVQLAGINYVPNGKLSLLIWPILC
jgi:hypothetical protein